MGLYKEFNKPFPNKHSFDYLKRIDNKIDPKQWEIWNGDFPYIDSIRWDDRPIIVLGLSKDYLKNEERNTYFVLKVTHTESSNRKTVDNRFKYKYELRDAEKEGLLMINKKTGKRMYSYVDCNYAAVLRPERFRNYRGKDITDYDSSQIYILFKKSEKCGELNVIHFNKILDQMEKRKQEKISDEYSEKFLKNIKLV